MRRPGAPNLGDFELPRPFGPFERFEPSPDAVEATWLKSLRWAEDRRNRDPKNDPLATLRALGDADIPEDAGGWHPATMTESISPAVSPMLATPDPEAAIAFYETVFGAQRSPLQLRLDGALVHGEILIGGVVIMIGAAGGPNPTEDPLAGPKLNLMVDDADAVCARAVAHGAELLIPVSDQFYGHRAGRIRDPFGYAWVLSQVKETLSPQEMQARLDAMAKGN